MRAVLLVIALFCVGCVSKKTSEFVPAHSRKVAVKLADSLGVITMYVPERYDTGFTWGAESDCATCNKIKYRFQASTWPIYEESEGWVIRRSIDSTDQITIVHDEHLYFDYNDSSWIYKENEHFREKMKAQGMGPECYLIDTLYRIYDRPFSITGDHYHVEAVCMDFYELAAVTSVRGMDIAFEFKLITDKKDSIREHFVQNALDILQTIRFTAPSLPMDRGHR